MSESPDEPKGIDGDHTDWEPAFHCSKQQREAAASWMERHDKAKHIKPGETQRYSGAIGGAYSWRFTPTGLGTVVRVICSCGDEIDITNYDEW